MKPKTQAINNKKKKTSYISSKFKTSVLQRTPSKVKRQPSEWEKIFENLITDKALVSRTHKDT